MKKIIAVLLAAVMCLSAFTGCGSKATAASGSAGSGTSGSGAKDLSSFKIGLSIWGTSDAHGSGVTKAVNWYKSLGGTVVTDVAGMTLSADSQVSSVEHLINSGVDMVTLCAYSGQSVIAKISQLCKQNKVYWSLWDTTISDPQIQSIVAADPYYCGNTNEDGVTAGYNAVKTLAQAGSKNFILIKYALGVATCDDREKGATKAIDELGLKKVYTIVAPSDVSKAVQDALTNYPQTDAIVALGGCAQYLTPSIQGIKAVGKAGQIKTAGFDFYDAMKEDVSSKKVSLVIGGHVSTSYFAGLLALSAWRGKPINPDKKQLTIPYVYITSTDNIDQFNKYVMGDTPPYTKDEMMTALNSSSLDDLQKIASKWSIEDIISRQSKK